MNPSRSKERESFTVAIPDTRTGSVAGLCASLAGYPPRNRTGVKIKWMGRR